MHVRLHDFSSKNILDRIRDDRLQLGLIVAPTKASELHDLRYEELFRERVCVAVAPQHPFARRRTVPIAEVAGEPLIGHDPRRLFELLRLSFVHLFEVETETAGGRGARQLLWHHVGRRSGNRRYHCYRRFGSHFRKPSKACAHHP